MAVLERIEIAEGVIIHTWDSYGIRTTLTINATTDEDGELVLVADSGPGWVLVERF